MKVNNLVTKSYLDKKLLKLKNELKEAFVTKDYLDKKLEAFVTKSYLGRKFRNFEKSIDYKMDQRFSKMKDELIDMKDVIVGEIQAMREEFNVHQVSHIRINDEIEEL